MDVAELKYFETGNSLRRVKSYSKSLNLFYLRRIFFSNTEYLFCNN